MQTFQQILLTLHILGFISWFAGLFYLPRLFVYHAMTNSLEIKNQFLVMERKLYYYIMYPAMIITILSGYTLMEFKYGYFSPSGVPHYPLWLHIKLIFVLFLIIFHLSCGYFYKKFKSNSCNYTHRFFRFLNEVPTLILIIIACLVAFRP